MIKTLAETQAFTEEVLDGLEREDGAAILALQGDLGAGKTTFTQALARALGVTSEITSPTFVIQKMYDLENQKFDQLVHIDAYRLESEQEINALGWNEIIANPKNLIVIEWPEKIAGAIPDTAHTITFETVSETERNITI